MNDFVLFLLLVAALAWTVLGCGHMLKLQASGYFRDRGPDNPTKPLVMMLLCGPVAWICLVIALIVWPFSCLYDWARY